MQHTHTHKTVTGRVEAKKLLSRRRQSNYNYQLLSDKLPLKILDNNIFTRGIGQYFEILFSAEFHLSCKMQLLIYKYKKKSSKIPIENKEIINFY